MKKSLYILSFVICARAYVSHLYILVLSITCKPLISLTVTVTVTQIMKEEGVWSLYKALPPRLLSVMPMIGWYECY